jgi:hypothetical protein
VGWGAVVWVLVKTWEGGPGTGTGAEGLVATAVVTSGFLSGRIENMAAVAAAPAPALTAAMTAMVAFDMVATFPRASRSYCVAGFVYVLCVCMYGLGHDGCHGGVDLAEAAVLPSSAFH